MGRARAVLRLDEAVQARPLAPSFVSLGKRRVDYNTAASSRWSATVADCAVLCGAVVATVLRLCCVSVRGA